MAPSSDSKLGSDESQPKRPARNVVHYAYPDAHRVLGFLETLPGMREESRRCVANLLNYRMVRTYAWFPRGQSAAVLVPLFVGRSGDLYVLLSRRSDALKTFAGDTALPGGKVDVQDMTIEDTARREAFEEIGLPQDKERIPLLCVMEPHLAKGEILVTPVVVLIIDHNLQPNLNSSEVTSIFAQPLFSFLSSTPYPSGGRMANQNELYHTFDDIPWSNGGTIRLHRFLTGREREGVKPVFGLTASILIKTATVGYGRTPDFEVHPPDAPTPVQQIVHALRTPTNRLRMACEQEGIDVDETIARLLRPPRFANAARTIEWEKIGVEWIKLMEGKGCTADVYAVVNAALTEGRESHSGSLETSPGDDGLKEAMHREGLEGQAAKESEKKGEDLLEGHQRAVSNAVELGKLLDETRDMVNERMREIRVDEKRLAEARKIYPKIMEQVKKSIEHARKADGELDLEKLLAMVLKMVRNAMKGGINASEGVKEGVDRGNESTQRTNKVMETLISQGDDDEALHMKRDVKL